MYGVGARHKSALPLTLSISGVFASKGIVDHSSKLRIRSFVSYESNLIVGPVREPKGIKYQAMSTMLRCTLPFFLYLKYLIAQCFPTCLQSASFLCHRAAPHAARTAGLGGVLSVESIALPTVTMATPIAIQPSKSARMITGEDAMQ